MLGALRNGNQQERQVYTTTISSRKCKRYYNSKRKFSAKKHCSSRKPRIYRINTVRNTTGLPTVKLSSSDLINACNFMIDSGSGINLIKKKFLQSNVKINNKEILPLKGIASEIISTLGSVEVSLLGQTIKFYLLSDTTNFPYDGILGNKFLRDKSINIDYKNKCLRYDYMEITFVKTEKIQIKKRSVIPFYVNITNPEKRVGYIPRYFIAENVYLGDVIVTNTNEKAYLKLFNSSEKEYEIKIPYMEIQVLRPAVAREVS